jgi:hypothetical protein
MRGRSADPRLKSIDIGQKLYPAPRLPASLDETETFDSLSEMPPTWYVTFENRKRGILPKRRSPRETRTFATEDEAKVFARAKLDEGVVVFAGTINPYLPRRHIPSDQVYIWLAENPSEPPLRPDGE